MDEQPASTDRVRSGIGDVMINLVRPADTLDLDLTRMAQDKFADSARRYPAGR